MNFSRAESNVTQTEPISKFQILNFWHAPKLRPHTLTNPENDTVYCQRLLSQSQCKVLRMRWDEFLAPSLRVCVSLSALRV